jgi:AbrB family looped-hinge helix DNA binding protein
MTTIYATVTSKGQITLPARVRRALHLGKGDRIAITLSEGDTHAVLRPIGSVVDELFASVPPRDRPANFDAQRKAFADETAKEVVEELD